MLNERIIGKYCIGVIQYVLPIECNLSTYWITYNSAEYGIPEGILPGSESYLVVVITYIMDHADMCVIRPHL